nr:growth arrest and DNA damage-inducible protein GADD45 alpha [Pelodiscus sinensis]|eukprot:XP_006125103.2 growth arrest and DNA damage-inducible protein GADD45 alpha [Pelodiscus sinensis]
MRKETFLELRAWLTLALIRWDIQMRPAIPPEKQVVRVINMVLLCKVIHLGDVDPIIASFATMGFSNCRERLLTVVRVINMVLLCKVIHLGDVDPIIASFATMGFSNCRERLLTLTQRSVTIGVYEAAKLLNVDPDNVVLCLLAADEEDDRDVALQIHFTLIQAFCCENDINILRVSNPGRLAELLLLGANGGAEQPADLHCVLVTNPHASQWKDPALSQLICFCRESRYMDQWVPVINLPER